MTRFSNNKEMPFIIMNNFSLPYSQKYSKEVKQKIQKTFIVIKTPFKVNEKSI